MVTAIPGGKSGRDREPDKLDQGTKLAGIP